MTHNAFVINKITTWVATKQQLKYINVPDTLVDGIVGKNQINKQIGQYLLYEINV